jgi:Clostridial binary toxin A.
MSWRYIGTCVTTVDEACIWDATEMAQLIDGSERLALEELSPYIDTQLRKKMWKHERDFEAGVNEDVAWLYDSIDDIYYFFEAVVRDFAVAETDQDSQLAAEDEAISWGERYYASWANSLSPSEQKALRSYAYYDFELINRKLRGLPSEIEDAEFKRKVANIDNALRRARVPEDVMVYRGAVLDTTNLVPGTVIREDGYLSTSLVDHPARRFAQARLKAGKPAALFRILVPKGAHAAFLGREQAPVSDEVEMLVQRGSEVTVDRIEPGDDGVVVIDGRLTRWQLPRK